MRERKPYPNISDEELDRRAEETLRRMLANPKQAQQLGQAPQGNQGQHARGDGQPNHPGGHQHGQNPNQNPNQNQPGRGKRRQRRRPR